MPRTKHAVQSESRQLGAIIPSFRVSEELSEEIKIDLVRRRKEDPHVPDQYGFNDHLRFLLRRGIETAKY